MRLRNLLVNDDSTPLVMISDDNDMFIYIKGDIYLTFRVDKKYLNNEYLDLSELVTNRDTNYGWAVINLSTGDCDQSEDQEIPEELYSLANNLVIKVN